MVYNTYQPNFLSVFTGYSCIHSLAGTLPSYFTLRQYDIGCLVTWLQCLISWLIGSKIKGRPFNEDLFQCSLLKIRGMTRMYYKFLNAVCHKYKKPSPLLNKMEM